MDYEDTDEEFLARARSMCPTKGQYLNRKEAERSGRKYRHDLTVYLCPFCGYWHLTSGGKTYLKQFKRRLKRLMREEDQPTAPS